MANEPMLRPGAVINDEKVAKGQSLQIVEAGTAVSPISRDLSLRHGRNDYRVEIVRRGTFYEGYVSQLRPGDAFQFMEGPGTGRWFGVINPIKQLKGTTIFGGNGDPVFQFDGLEIMQAAPTIERRVPNNMLPGVTTADPVRLEKSKQAPQLPAPGDIDDVDFTEKDL